MERFEWFIKKANIDFKQHQYDGVKWCIENERSTTMPCGVKGGFIADEMGLGKTIMMIGVVLSNFLPRTLIILPSILIDQWIAEIKRTTGHTALLYYGPNKKLITLEQLNASPIVITSYNTMALKRTSTEVSPLHQVKWSRLIFDEAHHLRNGKQRFWGAKQLMAPIRWLVSGTPVQNRVKDYYNLCASLNLPSSFYKIPENRIIVAKFFLLKRTKLDVGIALPVCHLDTDTVDWKNGSERELSKNIHHSLKHSSIHERFQAISYARRVCILPEMLTGYAGDCDATKSSSKMDAVMRTLLSRIGNGNGKIVFCHYHLEMDTIVSRLQDIGFTDVATFDGRTLKSKRTGVLKEGHEILIVQVQTGCEGLNLQDDYSEVYFVSPTWNPAIESQAIARCHRIGQKKEVHVFRFCMELVDEELQSIEEKMIGLQISKRELAIELFKR